MRRIAIACLVVCMTAMWAFPATAADTTVTGEIQETGMSGIILKGADGKAVKYWTGRETKYSPADWRPMTGDTVSVTYYVRTSNKGDTKLVASRMEMVKAGPLSVGLDSPASGTIRETGRSGFIVHLDQTNTTIKFARGRSTKYAPSGYNPAAGDRVKITFTRKPSRWGTGYVYIANIVEKE